MADEDSIVRKTDATPELATMAPAPFKPPRVGGHVEFVMDVTAEALQGTAKRATVKPNLPGWGAFEIRCDEGPSIGGTDSAPAPLAYLSAGVAFCMLTHLQYYIETHQIDVRHYRVEQRTRFSTNERTRRSADSPQAGCLGIEMQLVIESDAPQSVIRELANTAKALCMAHQALLSPTPSVFGVRLNGASVADLDA